MTEAISGQVSDGKALVVSKHLVDTNLFSFDKLLLDARQVASMKMLTVLTHLPNLINYEKLEWSCNRKIGYFRRLRVQDLKEYEEI